MSDITKMHAMRPGVQTSEFRGKTIVQALVLGALLLQQFGLDVAITEETALVIVAGLEAAYSVGRSLLKAFGVRDAVPAAAANA